MRAAYLTGLSTLALTIGASSHAQITPPPAAGPPSTAAAAAGLEGRDSEIIVTASRRAQTLQQTPIAVSVTTGATIEQAQIRDLIDLQSVVPSLRVNQNQNSGATTFTIRGFGNGANNPGIEPSVGVFIDGVYRSRSAAQITDLPNIERIEVLRGPQSTLFGKNASAGVISIITQKPQFELGGSASATYGNYNTVVLKADVTGPITDKVAFSLAGDYNRRDGYFTVLNLDKDINNRDRYDIRAQLLIKPVEDLEIRIIGDYSRINELCCATSNVVNGPTGPILSSIIGRPAVVAQAPFSDTNLLNRLPRNNIQNYGVSGQIDYNFGNLNLTSITAYRRVGTTTNDDSDFTFADIIVQDAKTKIHTFTQEVRLTSSFDGPLNFLLGGYYFDEGIKFRNDVILGADARNYLNVLGRGGLSAVEGIIGAPVGKTFFQPGQGTSDNFDFSDRSYSVFGSADFKPFERLTLTGGFNYTHDRKNVTSGVITTEPFSAIDLVVLGVALGVPPALANGPANPLIGLNALQFLPPFLNFPNAVESGKTRDSNVSYTLRAAYELNRHLNFYATYATGFKASSFNLSRDSRPFPADFIPGSSAGLPRPAASPIRDAGLAIPNLTTGSRFAGPEDAKVIEGGIKGSFPLVSFNLAVFQQEIKGFQGNVFTGTGFVLSNAGKQSTFGIEFEGSVTPVDPLNLFLSVTYLDAKFDSFRNSAVGDISGQKVAGVSPLTLSTGATFTQKFDNGMKLIARGDYHYESETQVAQGLPGFITTTGGVPNFDGAIAIGRQFKRQVNEINASLTLQFNHGLEVSGYVRNLTNDRYLTAIFDGVAQTGSVFGYTNQPRTYGGTVRYKF